MQLSQLVFLLPFLGVLAGMIIYRFQGRRDVLKLDVVQFYYVFILGPTIFVWLKTAIYIFLQTAQLSNRAMFATDTFFSVIFLFFYAFMVMHGLTKTFWLKNHDPLYDLFLASEYIHLWLSHLVMYVMALIIIIAISLMNLWFPLNWFLNQQVFLLLLLLSFVFGILLYVFMITADPKQGDDFRLIRVFKLGLGIAFSAHATLFVINTPEFNSQYIIFWSIFAMIISSTTLGFISYRSERVSGRLDQFLRRFLHNNWGNNILLKTGKQNGWRLLVKPKHRKGKWKI